MTNYTILSCWQTSPEILHYSSLIIITTAADINTFRLRDARGPLIGTPSRRRVNRASFLPASITHRMPPVAITRAKSVRNSRIETARRFLAESVMDRIRWNREVPPSYFFFIFKLKCQKENNNNRKRTAAGVLLWTCVFVVVYPSPLRPVFASL